MKNFARLLFIFAFISAAHAEFIGIPKASFDSHYRPQQEAMWCWASSAEMVLSYQGIKLPHAEIVTRIKGLPVNASGSIMDMIRSTNSIFLDENNDKVIVSGQYIMGAPFPTVLYTHLKDKRPVILTYYGGGSIGHAVVVTGAEVTYSANDFMINKLHVFDPFPYVMGMTPMGPKWVPGPNYKVYDLKATPSGIAIPPGIITGVILMDGAKM